MNKARLYFETIRHLKPSQIMYRVWRKAGGSTRLSPRHRVLANMECIDLDCIPVVPELDFDPLFQSRFDADKLLDDRVVLLNHEETVDWNTSWHKTLESPLWSFNLHYCEYILVLAYAYRLSGDSRYYEKAKMIIESWIDNCPEEKGGNAWEPYTISLRVVNWLAFLGELKGELKNDHGFMLAVNQSLACQYSRLSRDLEVDLLANHYLENLKALVLLACYFQDSATLNLAITKLCEQVDEQILLDGMHFELSPMYHKIVFEDLLRVALAMGRRNCSIDFIKRFRLQEMLDCLYSFERYTNTTPLFNDCGNNVSKSKESLILAAKNHLGIYPRYKDCFPYAGYYLLQDECEGHVFKVIVDAGELGPEYAMGHSHCDALSVELYVDGEPVLVNSGTYAYQSKDRLEYKSTLAHNTVMANGDEQAVCWASFRTCLAGAAHLLDKTGNTIIAVFDRASTEIKRSVRLENGVLSVTDVMSDACLSQSWHIAAPDLLEVSTNAERCELAHGYYSSDFGMRKEIVSHQFSGPDEICTEFRIRYEVK